MSMCIAVPLHEIAPGDIPTSLQFDNLCIFKMRTVFSTDISSLVSQHCELFPVMTHDNLTLSQRLCIPYYRNTPTRFSAVTVNFSGVSTIWPRLTKASHITMPLTTPRKAEIIQTPNQLPKGAVIQI